VRAAKPARPRRWKNDFLDMRAALEENIVDRGLIFSSQAKKRHLVPRRQPRQQLGGRLAAVARVEPGRKRRANEKSAPYVAVAFSFVLGSDTGPSLGNVGSIVAAPGPAEVPRPLPYSALSD
jgi:hypothetical protein